MSTRGRGETVLSSGKQSWQLQGGGARAATFFHRLRRERPAGRAGEGTRPGVRGRGIGGHSLRYPERVSAPQVKRRNTVKSGLLRHKGHWSGSCQLRQQLLLLASERPLGKGLELPHGPRNPRTDLALQGETLSPELPPPRRGLAPPEAGGTPGREEHPYLFSFHERIGQLVAEPGDWKQQQPHSENGDESGTQPPREERRRRLQVSVA